MRVCHRRGLTVFDSIRILKITARWHKCLMPLSSFVSTSTWEREKLHTISTVTMEKNEFETLTGAKLTRSQ